MAQVKAAMKRAWNSYRLKAWLRDELSPISGGNKTTFGGWAATLVDSLDTLYIMDMKTEFNEAVDAVVDIDFSKTSMHLINVFETTIRYLGGFLSAYDLSGDERLLMKALELAHMLYAAFDTPNRMPIMRWNLHWATKDKEQGGAGSPILAEIGSLSLEFTRLSQITGDPKWYDAIERIMALFDAQQHLSNLPGMWPLQVNADQTDFFTGATFSLAAWSDSMYEYLPKMHALLGGSPQYSKMYQYAMDTAIRHAIYRPMIKDDRDILMSGTVRVDDGRVSIHSELQHLVCFAGGMFALGGRLVNNASHVNIGHRLTNGCVWAYDHFPTGVMPETSTLVPCDDEPCKWDAAKWHIAVSEHASSMDKRNNTRASDIIRAERLPTGIASIGDRRYLLRPEAIESVFILYRITGIQTLQENAWNMFRSVYSRTQTPLANAALKDVTNATDPILKEDSMESFWTAETLKYFYLTFADPEYISLDDYVFNTEAHPFKRPVPKFTKQTKGNGWRWKWK
ncbi:hypothetical protein PRZ48_008323 [Zasmidium cellare]|uniref:alpha-1,2-Mannosidase n=1 Tax=Zasmidium cellare TaxID=395010 RepID=A0ABR0EF77_ZASCE|nr:hypothetical protein PRZ48_008323 [Zasmidium cellare]